MRWACSLEMAGVVKWTGLLLLLDSNGVVLVLVLPVLTMAGLFLLPLLLLLVPILLAGLLPYVAAGFIAGRRLREMDLLLVGMIDCC